MLIQPTTEMKRRITKRGMTTTENGQTLFTALKLRSEGLVPPSGALSRPSELHSYGCSTARLFPPRKSALVRDSRSFRTALRANQPYQYSTPAPAVVLALRDPYQGVGGMRGREVPHRTPSVICDRQRENVLKKVTRNSLQRP